MSILRRLTIKYNVSFETSKKKPNKIVFQSDFSIYSEYSDEHSFSSAIYRSRKNFWTFAQKLFVIWRITRLTLGLTACFNCSKIFASWLTWYSFQSSDIKSCSVFFTIFSSFDRSCVCWVAIPRIFDNPGPFFLLSIFYLFWSRLFVLIITALSVLFLYYVSLVKVFPIDRRLWIRYGWSSYVVSGVHIAVAF